jgi:hypothetical protein
MPQRHEFDAFDAARDRLRAAAGDQLFAWMWPPVNVNAICHGLANVQSMNVEEARLAGIISMTYKMEE